MQVQAVTNLISAHPVQATLAAKAVWDAIVGALAAPTKDSSTLYVFFFKLLNGLAFNFHRANSTAIESSPNFMPAVERYIAGLSPEDVAKIVQGVMPVAQPSPPKP